MQPSAPGTSAGKPGMEFSVSRSDLLNELSIAQGVVGNKSTVPIITSFLFEGLDGRLLITATDLDVSLRTFCPANSIQVGSCSIPARKLYEYVRLLRDEKIVFRVLENHWVQIRCGRSHTKMVGMSRENFPVLPLFPADTSVQLPAQILRAMIGKTIFAVSQEETRYTLKGALLVVKPDSLKMVATDGHRLALIEESKCAVGVSGEIRAVIPRKAMSEIYGLLNTAEIETVRFAKDDSTLFFAIGSRLLTSRQLTGTFPNYEAVLPRDLTHSVEIPATQLAAAVQRVSQFSDDRSNAIRLRIESNLLKLSSSCPEMGESEDSLEIGYGGEPFTVRFNSRYILDFLRVAGGGNVRFHFKGADTPGEFRTDPASSGDQTYRYVVMPMRS
jgi:DNA polymerase-3 subunit beta